MIKIVALLKRKPGITHEEFAKHWFETHGPLAIKLMPGIKKYVQNHPIKLPGKGEPPYDGITEIWVENMKVWEQLNEFFASDAGKPFQEDELKFLDRSKMVFFIAEEKVMK